jgi:WD40 repeat protein
MASKFKKISSILIVLTFLTGCRLSTPTPSATPAPSSTVTNTAVQLPTLEPTLEPTVQPTEQIVETPTQTQETITAQNVDALALSDSITLPTQVEIKWSLDQQSVILTSYQGFWVYSYPDLDLLFEYATQPDEMLVDVSADGFTYVLSLDQSALVVTNWQTQESHTIQTNIIFSVGDISPDGTKIILAHQDEWIGSVFDLTSGALLATVTGFETAAPVYSVTFGEDGSHAIWHARATIQLSDIATNSIAEPIFHEDFLSSFSLSPNGEILTTSAYGTVNDEAVPQVFFYDAANGETLGATQISTSAFSLGFSPNSLLLAAAEGPWVTLIDTTNFMVLHQINADPERAVDAQFSPEGNVLAVSGENMMVSFWSIP